MFKSKHTNLLHKALDELAIFIHEFDKYAEARNHKEQHKVDLYWERTMEQRDRLANIKKQLNG